jgi:hypothetical protein
VVATTSAGLTSMPRATLVLAGLLYLTACEEWHLSINSDGLVFISVLGETGESRHRFRVRTRNAGGAARIVDIPSSGQLTLTPVADGTLELTLLAPEGCRVAGSNPRTLSVAAGQEVATAFEVRCFQEE